MIPCYCMENTVHFVPLIRPRKVQYLARQYFMKLQSLIKYSYAWNCVNNPTWKVSTFQRTDSVETVNNTMQLAFSTNHQYVPCVINTNTKRERMGYLRVFLMRTRGITPELELQALLKCAPMHTRGNIRV